MADLPAGTVMVWDRARGVDIEPVYALVNDRGRAIVFIGNDALPAGCDLPGYVYSRHPDMVARNRVLSSDEWPDKVVACMAYKALTGEVLRG